MNLTSPPKYILQVIEEWSVPLVGESKKLGYSNLIGRTSKELDLRNQSQVYDFLKDSKPVVIIDAAAKLVVL